MSWKSVIADLQGTGLSQPQIAEKCGCRQGTISALATGKTQEPRFGLGEKLLALLRERGGGEARAAPAVPYGAMPAVVQRRAVVGEG